MGEAQEERQPAHLRGWPSQANESPHSSGLLSFVGKIREMRRIGSLAKLRHRISPERDIGTYVLSDSHPGLEVCSFQPLKFLKQFRHEDNLS